MPIIPPVQPCFFERVAYAADTSAGKRKYFDGFHIVFDPGATGAQVGTPLTGERAAAAAVAFDIDFTPDRFLDAMSTLDEQIGTLSTRAVREQAQLVLNDARATLREAMRTGQLPRPRMIEAEDGSASVEWITPKYRLAFTFDPDPKESGWIFVSCPEAGGVLASGKYSGLQLASLIAWSN